MISMFWLGFWYASMLGKIICSKPVFSAFCRFNRCCLLFRAVDLLQRIIKHTQTHTHNRQYSPRQILRIVCKNISFQTGLNRSSVRSFARSHVYAHHCLFPCCLLPDNDDVQQFLVWIFFEVCHFKKVDTKQKKMLITGHSLYYTECVLNSRKIYLHIYATYGVVDRTLEWYSQNGEHNQWIPIWVLTLFFFFFISSSRQHFWTWMSVYSDSVGCIPFLKLLHNWK